MADFNKKYTVYRDVFQQIIIVSSIQVRVCDTCFDQFGPKEEAGARAPVQQQSKKKQESDLPAEYLASALAKQVFPV